MEKDILDKIKLLAKDEKIDTKKMINLLINMWKYHNDYAQIRDYDLECDINRNMWNLYWKYKDEW